MNTEATSPLMADNINYTCDTIEDYLRVAIPPVGQDVRHAFSVVQRPARLGDEIMTDIDGKEGVVELVSGRFDAKREKHILVHVRPVASGTGWECNEIELDAARNEDGALVPVRPVSRIEAFYQSYENSLGDVVHGIFALLHFQMEDNPDYYFVMGMQFDEAEGWQQWDLSDLAQRHVRNHLVKNRQTAVYRDINGKHVFYGVSGAGFDERLFMIFQTSEGSWKAVSHSVKVEGHSTFRIVPARDNWDQDEWTEGLLRIDGNEIFLSPIQIGNGLTLGDEEKIFQSQNELTAANIIPLPTRTQARGFLLHSADNGHLYYVSDFHADKPSLSRLSGLAGAPAALEQVVIGRTRENQCILFAASRNDHKLWVLRQAGVDADNVAVFGDWVCLGEQVRILGCPRAMLDGPELFFVDMKRRLKHMSQDLVSTFWNAETVAIPRPSDSKPEKITCHCVRLSTLSSEAAPVPRTKLKLWSSHPVVVMVHDYAVHIDPIRPVEVFSDQFANVRIRIPADKLTSTTLYVSLDTDDCTNPVVIEPNDRLAYRLKNKKVNAASLKQANIIPRDLDNKTANDVARLYKHIPTLSSRANGDGKVPKAKDEIQTYDFEVYEDEKGRVMDTDYHKEPGKLTPRASFPQNAAIWVGEQLTKIPILGDFLLQLRNGIISFGKLMVRFARKSGLLDLHFKIGDKVVNLQFLATKAIEAIDAVANAMAELFRKIGKAVKNAALSILQWLAGVLGWDDIIRTNEAIKLFAFAGLEGLAQFLDQKAVDWTQSMVDKIVDMLDMAEEQFRDLCEQFVEFTGGKDQKGMTQNFVSNTMQSESVMMHTGFDAASSVFSWLEEQGNKVLDDLTPDDPDIREFVASFRTLLANLKENTEENIVEPAGKALSKIFDRKTFTNPHNFIGLLPDMFAVIKGALKLAVQTGGDIIIFILKSVATALKLLKRFLALELDFIPFISEAYQRFHPQHAALQIADLLSLPLAIPATLLHKLLFRHGPISDDQWQTINDKNGISWSGTLGAGLDMALSDNTLDNYIAQQKSVGAMATQPKPAPLDVGALQVKVANSETTDSEATLKQATSVVDAVDKVFCFGKIIAGEVETNLLTVKSADAFEPEGTPGALAYLWAHCTRIFKCALELPNVAATILNTIVAYREVEVKAEEDIKKGKTTEQTFYSTVLRIFPLSILTVIIDFIFSFTGAIVFLIGAFIPVVAFGLNRVMEYLEIGVNLTMVLGLGAVVGILFALVLGSGSKDTSDYASSGKYAFSMILQFLKNIWKIDPFKKGVIKKTKKIFKTIGEKLKPFKEKVIAFANKAWKGIKKFFKALLTPVKWLFKKIGELFGSAPAAANSGAIFGNLVAIGGAIISAILAVVQWVAGHFMLVVSVITCVVSFVIKAYEVAKQEAEGMQAEPAAP